MLGKLNILLILFFLDVTFLYASPSVGTIDPSNIYTKVCHDSACSTYGVINFGQTSTTSIRITDTAITGYAWGNEIGWVNMAPTGAGVTVDPNTALLYGTAWSELSGWINFRPTNSGTISGGIPIGVSITDSGEFYGWAWNGGIYGGWIKFDCSATSTCVKTDWRKVSLRPVASSGGNGGTGLSGSSGGGWNYGASTSSTSTINVQNLATTSTQIQTPQEVKATPVIADVKKSTISKVIDKTKDIIKSAVSSITKPQVTAKATSSYEKRIITSQPVQVVTKKSTNTTNQDEEEIADAPLPAPSKKEKILAYPFIPDFIIGPSIPISNSVKLDVTSTLLTFATAGFLLRRVVFLFKPKTPIA